MATNWIETVTGSFDDKRRWRAYKARKAGLPGNHRAAIDAVERYLLHAGGIAKGDVLVQMCDDLLDLFDAAAADGTPVREIVGDDPVEFAETFAQAYAGKQWIDKERARLVSAIDTATSAATGSASPDGIDPGTTGDGPRS